MSDNDPINYVWGTQYRKERREKEFIEKQDEEATRTRKAAEQTAEETRRLRDATEAIGRAADEQSSILERRSDEILDEVIATRNEPDILFQLIQTKELAFKCEEVLTDSPSASCEMLAAAHKMFAFYVQKVFAVDRSHIIDFAQKNMLDNLRSETRDVVTRLNATYPPFTKQRYLEWFLLQMLQPLLSFKPEELSSFTKEAQLYNQMRLNLAPSEGITRKITWSDITEKFPTWLTFVTIGSYLCLFVSLLSLFGEWAGGWFFLLAFLCAMACYINYYFSIRKELQNNIELRQWLESTHAKLNSIYPIDSLEDLIQKRAMVLWERDGWVIKEEAIEKAWLQISQLMTIPTSR